MPGSVASKLACAANALNSPAYPSRFVQGGILNLEKWVRIVHWLYMGLGDLLSEIRIESQLDLTSLNVSSMS
jgi:hypothetical protein